MILFRREILTSPRPSPLPQRERKARKAARRGPSRDAFGSPHFYRPLGHGNGFARGDTRLLHERGDHRWLAEAWKKFAALIHELFAPADVVA